MDLENLMQMANQLRDRLSNAEGEAETLRASGEAGGGLVQILMNGKHIALEVNIDPKALADRKLLEDLVRAAINQAVAQVAVGLKARLGGVAKDFGVDLSMLEGLGFPK